MGVEAYLWIAAVLFLAGFARGYSGFGFSAVAVAGLSFVVSPAVAVATAILLETAASLIQARSIWREVDWRGSAILLVGAIIGNPIGIAILEAAPQAMLKAIIYGFLLVVAAILTFVKPVRVELNSLTWFIVAVIAGVINGSTALAGLFIVAVMTVVAIPPARMRATLVAYFFFSDLYAAGILGYRGLIGADVLWLSAAALPVIAIGIFFGARKFVGASDKQFRRATLAFLCALSAAGLATLAFDFA